MKNVITHLLIVSLFAAALTGCRKDDVDPEELIEPGESSALLTRISRNGVTQAVFFYDIQKKLYRYDYYFNGNPANYTLFEYDEKGVGESRRYKVEDHSLEYWSVFTLDNFGRVIKSENYSSINNFEEVSSIVEFSYATTGLPSAKQLRISGQPVLSKNEYTYDSLKNLISIKNIQHPNQLNEYLNYQHDYFPGSKQIPGSWEDYVLLLLISSFDDRIRDMFCESSSFKSWDSNQELKSDINFQHTGHVYNDEGHLLRQVITRKNMLNPGADQVGEMTYDYLP